MTAQKKHFWQDMKHHGSRAFRWIVVVLFPLIGVAVVISIGLSAIWPFFGIEEYVLTALLVFFVPCVGSMILQAIRANERPGLRSVGQDDAISLAMSKVKKNDDVNILIYTSFSLFNNLDNFREKFPRIKNAKIRILARDPDLHSGYRCGKYAARRFDQLKLVIDSLDDLKGVMDVQVKFYQSDPWLRGISVDHRHLLLSHYTDRSRVVDDEESREYSGRDTPWIVFDVDRLLGDQARSQIDRFNDLFELIWKECTVYKYLLVDLDGTIVGSQQLSQYTRHQLPEILFREKATADVSFDQLRKDFERRCVDGVASTTAIIDSVQNLVDADYKLADYASWKDQQMQQVPVDSWGLVADEDTRKALLQLKSRYKLCLFTNHTTYAAERLLSESGLEGIFDREHLLTSDVLDAVKPCESIVHALGSRGIDLQSAIVVGDRDIVDFKYLEDIVLACIRVDSVSSFSSVAGALNYPIGYIKRNPAVLNGATLVRDNVGV